MFDLKDSTLRAIIREIQKFPEIEEAVVFGSRAKGSNAHGSDIDIAIKGPHVSSMTVNQLSRLLNQEAPIPHHIDIVHYETITNPSLLEHIDRVGETLPLHVVSRSVGQ